MTVNVKITNDGKKIFTIDVGDMSAEAAIEYVEDILREILEKKINNES